MTRAEAHLLLDRVRDGDHSVNFRIIRQALEATGDIAPLWSREPTVPTFDGLCVLEAAA